MSASGRAGGWRIALCSRSWPADPGKCHPMGALMEARGHRVVCVEDGPLDLDAFDVVLLRGNANWYPAARKQLLARQRSQRPLVAVWHVEPLPLGRGSGLRWPLPKPREVARILRRDPGATDVYTNYFLLRRLARHGLPDVLAVNTQGWCEFLVEHGIPAEWVPIGYDRERDGEDLGLERDVDVLFIGDLTIPKRRRHLAALRRAGVDVQALGDWHDRAFWGEPRTHLLNRARILLNLQRNRGDLAGARFVLGMANGALVISEPVYRPDPYVPGVHFVSASVRQMPDAIAYYLAHPAERARIVAEAQRFVTQELTLGFSVERLLELIDRQLLFQRATVTPRR